MDQQDCDVYNSFQIYEPATYPFQLLLGLGVD